MAVNQLPRLSISEAMIQDNKHKKSSEYRINFSKNKTFTKKLKAIFYAISAL